MTPTDTEKKEWTTPVVVLLDEPMDAEAAAGVGLDGAIFS